MPASDIVLRLGDAPSLCLSKSVPKTLRPNRLYARCVINVFTPDAVRPIYHISLRPRVACANYEFQLGKLPSLTTETMANESGATITLKQFYDKIKFDEKLTFIAKKNFNCSLSTGIYPEL